MRFAIVFALVVLLPACATVTSTPATNQVAEQSITITTEPEGASCMVSRGDEVVAELEATPAEFIVDRDLDMLEIVCVRGGHRPTVAQIEAETIEASTLLGDSALLERSAFLAESTIGETLLSHLPAATTYTVAYPETIDMTLPRQSLTPGPVRPAAYARAALEEHQIADRAIEELQASCPEGFEAACRDAAAMIAAHRRDLQTQRNSG